MPEWEDETMKPLPKPGCHARKAVRDLEQEQAAEKKWPEATRLILDREELKVLKQHPALHSLLAHTLPALKAVLIFINPFPNAVSRDETIKTVMVNVTKDLGSHYKQI
jgi:hypothetical protein